MNKLDCKDWRKAESKAAVVCFNT